MACPKCGTNAAGQFCGTCGTAMGQESPVEVAETVGMLIPEAPISPDIRRPSDQGALRSVIDKLRGLRRGPAIGLAATGAIVVIVTLFGAGFLSTGGDANGSTSDTNGTGSSDTNGTWTQQCINQRIANGDSNLQAGVEAVARNEAESLCSSGPSADALTTNDGLVGANQ